MPPGVFTLELDTTAPQLEFMVGPAPRPNFPYTLGYVLDEPEILDAYLVDSLGQQWGLIVNETNFAQTLSSTVALGMGEVVVRVRDDVLNEHTYHLPVAVITTVLVRQGDRLAVNVHAEDDGSVGGEPLGDPAVVIVLADGHTVLVMLGEQGTGSIRLSEDQPVNVKLTDRSVVS